MATKKEVQELENRIKGLEEVKELLKNEMQVRSLLPTQLVEKLTRKREIAISALSKFTDDMIKDNKYINRLNAAMERQKIRDYTEILELIITLAEELPKVGNKPKEEK